MKSLLQFWMQGMKTAGNQWQTIFFLKGGTPNFMTSILKGERRTKGVVGMGLYNV